MDKPSLRHKLLLNLLWPLCLTWALGSGLVIGFAYYFTTQAYDRSLLDDAYTLAAQVHKDPASGLYLNLTDAETRVVMFDHSESNYFSIWRMSGRLLAGRDMLRPAITLPIGSVDANVGASTPVWSDGRYLGQYVRIVSLLRTTPEPYIVVVAQTTSSRNDLLRRLLLVSLIPQVLLLALLAWWLRRQVGLDLEPLSTLQTAVDERDTSDLRHIPVALAEQARTREIEHLGRAINSLFDRLHSGLQAQREFAGNVAHELRTPIASIRLQAEHALTLSENPEVQERMKKLLTSADHAGHLINQLLALAFADEAQNALPLIRLDLVEVVREAVLRHLPRADSLCVDLGAEGLDVRTPILIKAHRVFIDAILDNLIDNAFRYGLAAENPKITVTIDQTPDNVQLSVTDNGKGLIGQELDFYKSRWVRANDRRQAGQGVGLGLAIVIRYAELHAAKLTLTRVNQQGGLRVSLLFTAED